jgi:NAD-dependent dihydropyrimidine dehydrogenase PreA subunit
MVGKVTIDQDRCKCLAKCVQSCPQDVLEWNFDAKKAVVVDEIECFVCYNCVDVCPFHAITVTEVDWKPLKDD